MNTDRLATARTFLLANGRLLEKRLAEVIFDGNHPAAALTALRAYRNPDGGFGHGLEPDSMAPTSQPLYVQVAFVAMERADAADRDLIDGACSFLARLGPGVGCLLPDFARYPSASHWGEWALAPSLNPTAGLVAALARWEVRHPWRDAATAFCWQQLAAGLPGDAHGFGQVLEFLASHESDPRAAALVAAVPERLPSLEMFKLDPAEPGYGLTPLHYAPTPDGRWRSLFSDEVIDAHLDALDAAQSPDGGWPISWQPLGEAAGAAYRGVVTLEALTTLRAYGRLPG